MVRNILIVFVLMSTFCLAQTISIQAEHDQYLIDIQKKNFLKVEPEVITFQGCSKDGCVEISVRILENKFSALARVQDKKIYQEGVLSLEKQPELLVTTKFADNKEIKFVLGFNITANKTCVELEGNYAEVLPKEPADIVLVGVAGRLYPTIKNHIGTDHYKICIMSFIHAERPLFFLIAKGMLFQDEQRGFSCPRCNYPLYYYAHYCNSCNNCFSGSLLKCNNCWSSNWSNGKTCSQCQQCYR